MIKIAFLNTTGIVAMNSSMTLAMFIQEIKRNALRHDTAVYFGAYDELSDCYKEFINEQYRAIDRFIAVSESQLESQIKVFGFRYLSEDTVEGDLLWSDGHRLWSRDRFADHAIDTHEHIPNWLECCLLERDVAILFEFILYAE